jgi:hypothetical protein
LKVVLLYLISYNYHIMESASFTIAVNDLNYTVKIYSAMPKLYDVSCGAAYHQIGKTDAGLWVYVENPSLAGHMPLQEIGHAIDEYLGQEID